MIFDSHAHYDDKQFGEDRNELLSSMGDHGITKIVNVGASLEGNQRMLELVDQYEFLYGAAGIHPSDIQDLTEKSFAWLREQTRRPKVVAVGEIGLDYYWDKEPDVQERQRYWFCRQLQMAREEHLPVIIHSREAAEDTLEIMKKEAAGMSGVIHCFSYSRELAEEYVKMGFYIGIGGVLTFKNARKLKETAAAIPLDRIVIETDCPYLAPEPFRGKRNSSLYLPYVIEALARIRDLSPKEVEAAVYENTLKLYGLK